MSEPFGYFKAEPFGWTDCAETDEGAVALYEHPAVPQGWKLVPYDPSIDMQEHGSIASDYDLSQTRAKKVYQAMIDMHEVMMEREPTDQWLRLQAGYPEQPPAQRQWVGLTHDEYDAICDKHSAMSDFDFLADIETKLRGKNQ